MDEDVADKYEEQMAFGSKARDKGKGKGRAAGGGAGGRRGGAGGSGREVELSKALSKLLRHQAEKAGIKLDKEGFAPLDRVLQWGPLRSLAPSFAEVRNAVGSSDKQRFAMRPNPRTNPDLDEESNDPAQWLIRANQGHSIRLESEGGLLRPMLLDEDIAAATATAAAAPPSAPAAADANAAAVAAATDSSAAAIPASPLLQPPLPVPPVVVHGTYFAFWPAIVASGGLRPMRRTHVHFATGLGGAEAEAEDGTPSAAVVSGMRRDAELLVYVDVAQSLRDGAMTWWMSANGVVLTEGAAGEEGEGKGVAAAAAAGSVRQGLVPLRYFKEVVARRKESGVGVLWRDGEKVADLPEGLRVVVPMGKGRGGGRVGRAGRERRKV